MGVRKGLVLGLFLAVVLLSALNVFKYLFVLGQIESGYQRNTALPAWLVPECSAFPLTDIDFSKIDAPDPEAYFRSCTETAQRFAAVGFAGFAIGMGGAAVVVLRRRG